MCACLPTLRPLLNHIFPQLLYSTRRGTAEARQDSYTLHSVEMETVPELGRSEDGRVYEIMPGEQRSPKDESFPEIVEIERV